MFYLYMCVCIYKQADFILRIKWISGFFLKKWRDSVNIEIIFFHGDNSPDPRRAYPWKRGSVLPSYRAAPRHFTYSLPFLAFESTGVKSLLFLSNLTSPFQNQHLLLTRYLVYPLCGSWTSNISMIQEFEKYRVPGFPTHTEPRSAFQAPPVILIYVKVWEAQGSVLIQVFPLIFNSGSRILLPGSSLLPKLNIWIYITHLENFSIFQHAAQIYILSVKLPPGIGADFISLHISSRRLYWHLAKSPYLYHARIVGTTPFFHIWRKLKF